MVRAYWLDLYGESLSAIWWQDPIARSFTDMTETASTHTPLRISLVGTAPSRQAAGAITPKPQRHPRRTMPTWLPRRVLQRGATPTREDERALRDLRAAQDRTDW